MWRPFNPNPAGRRTGDCTVRAICAVTGWIWDRAHRELCDYAREVAFTMPSIDAAWWGFLRDIGFRQHGMIDRCPECYTVADFARDHPRGVYILGPQMHAVALIDGDWWDAWDSGGTVPTYFFRR